MEKYKKYYGIIIFLLVVTFAIYKTCTYVGPEYEKLENKKASVKVKIKELSDKKKKEATIKEKIKQLENAVASLQKKVYSPIESDLGNDTLFFTLYNDVIEMVHSNSLKIKSIDYKYNPEHDKFVEYEKGSYFVCDVNMDLVSNYTNLGKLIESIQQYPYYIRINDLDVKPYPADKKILISKLSLRLYAHTEPEVSVD